jgi:hypothetical protein
MLSHPCYGIPFQEDLLPSGQVNSHRLAVKSAGAPNKAVQ